MTIGEAIRLKLWEEYYLTDKGEILPVTKENREIWLTKNPRWSLVSESRPITTQDVANKNNPLSTSWRDQIIYNNHLDESLPYKTERHKPTLEKFFNKP